MLSKPLMGLMFSLPLVLAGCGTDSQPKQKPSKSLPAKVQSLPKEINLSDIELSQRAFDRLGISTAKVERRNVSQVRLLGGEITVPPGELAVVVAPIAGTVQPPEDSSPPKPGSSVKKGQAIFKFEPLLSPERFVPTPAERAQIANAQASLLSLQMTADGDVQQFTEQVAAARIALERAELLERDRVGSQRAVDDAKAQLALAEAGLKVSRERKEVLDRLSSDIERSAAAPIVFDSPIDGIVRSVPVTLGQTVAAGATLFEVVNLETLWIRVPVYVGLLDELRLADAVSVTFFGDNESHASLTATPIQAPPAADPSSSTADLFYCIPNEAGRFRPGERVSVAIPMTSEAESLVVPANAILYDIHGNAWVYTQVGELHFRRARVMVRRTTAEIAVLESGPPEGADVVVDGAAELFGTEFGTGK